MSQVRDEDLEYIRLASRLSKIGSWIIPTNAKGKIRRLIENILDAEDFTTTFDPKTGEITTTGVKISDKLKAAELAVRVNELAVKANKTLMDIRFQKEANEIKRELVDSMKPQENTSISFEFFSDRERQAYFLLHEALASGKSLSDADYAVYAKLHARVVYASSQKQLENLEA